MPVALAAAGRTGADVESYVKRAKAAARRSGREVDMGDLLRQIRAGAPEMVPALRHRIAVHEAGHVIVGRALGAGDFLSVSINHRGGEAAFADTMATSSTPREIENGICLLLAGPAAERLVFGDFAIGSGLDENSDLGRATLLLETKGGGTAGNLYLPNDMARNLLNIPGLIDAVKARLDEAEARAATILESNRALLESVASRLDAEGYLSAADVEQFEVVAQVREAAE